MKTVQNAFFGMIAICLAASCGTSHKVTTENRADVSGVEVTLTKHPDSVSLKAKDGKIFYLFFSLAKKCLVISDNPDIYEKFSTHLPETSIAGREVQIEASSINPFTYFSKEQLDDLSQHLGVELNKFKLYKIFNWSLVFPNGDTPTPATKKDRNSRYKVIID